MLEAVSPLMKQYFAIKNQHQDEIVFYRLGDFYEMFYDDAITASRELDLTLTGKNVGTEERAPMCGVPFHSYEAYAAKLIEKGYKVAICEQMEDPATAKGLVARDIIRVMTPGTLIESSMLDEHTNNYICSVFSSDEGYGMCFCDISTGEVLVTQLGRDAGIDDVKNEISRYSPREALISENLVSELSVFLRERIGCAVEGRDDWRFDKKEALELSGEHFSTCPELFESENLYRATGALLSYLIETQKNTLAQLSRPEVYETGIYMTLDHNARMNLELFETLRTRDKKGSLLYILDHTYTSMGARLLRRWIEKPLLNPATIRKRLNCVAALHDDAMRLGELEEALRGISDLERLISRVIVGTGNARDLRSLAVTAEKLPRLRELTDNSASAMMREIHDDLDPLSDLYKLIDDAIADEPALAVKEGGIIKKGYRDDLDDLRDAAVNGKGRLAAIQLRERERTGIKNLKVGYNKVFGYYIEVTSSFLNLVPDDYIRRQTLTGGERYITEELKNLEGTILGAQDKANNLEYDIFVSIRDEVAKAAERVQRCAKAIAQLDTAASLARTALDNNYCMPEVDNSDALRITDGRHPVVEQRMPGFVPNDVDLDCKNKRVAIITGPNMAGKSTYMRQSAIIILLAQIGSFVPAKSAHVGITDRIFTRIGASDDLSGGQSTFMVEMSEVSEIIREATSKSFIILDEIGRGTSTFDGMSIAQSVLEYCAKKIGAKTMFATHYHELTALTDTLPGVFNMSTAVRKHGDEITFLHRVIPGGADDSYGIEVAKLSGIPDDVIRRAKAILKSLEKDGPVKQAPAARKVSDQTSMADLGAIELTSRIRALDLDTLTPVQALNLLYELKTIASRLL